MTASFNQMEPIMTAAPVIPVLTISDLALAVPLCRALVRGGLKVLEITLRTEAALDAIRTVADQIPEAIVGAGTVLSPGHIDDVARAGGSFCVSPGSTPALLNRARDAGMQILPGAVTATEVMNLLEQDITHMKFFPAEASGGAPVLKNFSAPLAAARFCPTGGIKLSNARDYLSLPNVLCIGGSWVCPGDAVQAGDWARIENLAREAAASG